MKKEIVTLFLMTSVWAAQAQGTFTIEGQVKNVEDGALITLFRLDGNVGSSIGVDTIRNGHFRFQAETLGNETEIVDMIEKSKDESAENLSYAADVPMGNDYSEMIIKVEDFLRITVPILIFILVGIMWYRGRKSRK